MKKINVPVFIRKITDRIHQDKKCIKLGKGAPYAIYPFKEKNPIVYSGGVGKDISFELELVNRFNAQIFIFDPTEDNKDFMSKVENKNIQYFQKGLAEKTGKFKIDDGQVHQCVSISDFAKEQNHSKISLLKLDIEGFEYGVLKEVLKNPNLEVKQIVIEFHGWMKNVPRRLDREAKKELKNKGYRLIYKDIDNYSYIKE